ncbi:expressed unknown protein [Seminavis robusta]|uniref:Uncharacterized protein n=1 Tax=Seminavis robusta TaxID=568900 RepID=A0A9N8DPF6_9STRA|nr:expressed unknown protein [Seminavis robusta]|eukprot:Sro197_g083871.1  (126) ;mRNA; r:74722-75099
MDTTTSPANPTPSKALEQKHSRLRGRINRARSSRMRRGSSARDLMPAADKGAKRRQLVRHDSFASLHPNEILDLLVVSANEDPSNSFHCLQTIKNSTFEKPRRTSATELRGSQSTKEVPSSVELC